MSKDVLKTFFDQNAWVMFGRASFYRHVADHHRSVNMSGECLTHLILHSHKETHSDKTSGD